MSELPNPYAAPTSTTDLSDYQSVVNEVVPVSKGLRFANYLIDTFVCLILYFIAIFILIVACETIYGPDSSDSIDELWLNVFGILVIVVYYIVMEGAFGQTVGKLLTGTKVVDAQGNRAKLGAVTIRSLMRMVPLEPFSFLGNSPLGWHDDVSKTLVVKSRS